MSHFLPTMLHSQNSPLRHTIRHIANTHSVEDGVLLHGSTWVQGNNLIQFDPGRVLNGPTKTFTTVDEMEPKPVWAFQNKTTAEQAQMTSAAIGTDNTNLLSNATNRSDAAAN